MVAALSCGGAAAALTPLKRWKGRLAADGVKVSPPTVAATVTLSALPAVSVKTMLLPFALAVTVPAPTAVLMALTTSVMVGLAGSAAVDRDREDVAGGRRGAGHVDRLAGARDLGGIVEGGGELVELRRQVRELRVAQIEQRADRSRGDIAGDVGAVEGHLRHRRCRRHGA
jgi:hypothetical protein